MLLAVEGEGFFLTISMGGQITRSPNPKNPSLNPKNLSPKNSNANSGFNSRYPKLLRVIRVLTSGTRITRKYEIVEGLQ